MFVALGPGSGVWARTLTGRSVVTRTISPAQLCPAPLSCNHVRSPREPYIRNPFGKLYPTVCGARIFVTTPPTYRTPYHDGPVLTQANPPSTYEGIGLTFIRRDIICLTRCSIPIIVHVCGGLTRVHHSACPSAIAVGAPRHARPQRQPKKHVLTYAQHAPHSTNYVSQDSCCSVRTPRRRPARPWQDVLRVTGMQPISCLTQSPSRRRDAARGGGARGQVSAGGRVLTLQEGPVAR